MQKEERISSIDLIRVIAIFLIVLFHVLYELNSDNSLRPIGFIGLSLFFIVSGFALAKKYPEHENFSIKWFFKRYLKIASLYYLALVIIVALFQKQVYSGSLLKNLFMHFIFLDFISPETAYGIISPAWFLTPFIALYILFPYLNRFIKKYSSAIIFVFIIEIFVRIIDGTITSPSPLFFLGEFCFGIAFAFNNKNILLIFSLATAFVQPFMAFPFLLFYIISLIQNTSLPSKLLSFIGANTLVIFLFHEAFMKVILDRWHIFNLNRFIALIVLFVLTLVSVYLSKKIQNIPYRLEKLKSKKDSKNVMKTKTTITTIVIMLAILILLLIAIPQSSKIMLSPSNTNPLIEIQQVSTKNTGCSSTITGEIYNAGDKKAEQVIITCKRAAYPMPPPKASNILATKEIPSLDSKSKTNFEIIINNECIKDSRFECSASCKNC